jgi:hypothetical protein
VRKGFPRFGTDSGLLELMEQRSHNGLWANSCAKGRWTEVALERTRLLQAYRWFCGDSLFRCSCATMDHDVCRHHGTVELPKRRTKRRAGSSRSCRDVYSVCLDALDFNIDHGVVHPITNLRACSHSNAALLLCLGSYDDSEILELSFSSFQVGLLLSS